MILRNKMPTIKKIIYDKIQTKKNEIDSFFESKYKLTRPLFYSSVDIRYSGYKIVPVDTNLFPAGFNLLSEKQAEKATLEAKNYIEKFHSGKINIVIVPENHTRNKYYLMNVQRLSEIISNAGYNVKIGSIMLSEVLAEELPNGKKIEIFPLLRNENKIVIGDFVPDIIINNNDLSSGKPELLKNLSGQPIIPPVSLGWFKRRKSQHFESYDDLAREFAKILGIDSWLISTYFMRCGSINFKEKSGLENVANDVEEILAKTKKKYAEFGIEEQPYAFIKANSGTYGMGIMVVKSANEVLEINKKIRHSMNVIKEGVENSEVIIQEGVPTIDNFEGNPAEPLVYLVNSNPVGCNYRLNKNQDKFGNLNSSGMEFMTFDKDESNNNMNCPVQELIARLASLAAAFECYEQNWDI
jgi:glutamate--cysteine ligase